MTVSGSVRWLIGAAVACELLACAASDDPGRRALPQAMGTAGAAGNAGASGGSAGVSGFGNAGVGAGAGGTGGAAGGSPNDCGGMTYEGEVKGKLDMLLLVDTSGSMFGVGVAQDYSAMPGTPPATVFEPLAAALKTFLADPQSAGIGVALRSYNEICDVNVLATPEVPMADLPGNAPPIASWLDQQWSMYMPMGYSPSTNSLTTNTYPAIQGGIQYMVQWAAAHPESKVAMLVATDGARLDKDDCGSSDLAAIAAEGASMGIPIYALGFGDTAVLQTLAASGGTGQPFIISDPSRASSEVVAKLNAIRGAAQPLPCEFLIPQGGERTPDLVNLDYAGIGAAALARMPRVDSEAGCGSTLAWHYDNPAAPTTVVACPDACTKFVNEGGQVSIALGCPTLVVE